MGRILITGAAGFIGSHTVDRLLLGGHEVLGLDNFRTGRRENLAGALRHARFAFEEADVSADEVLESRVRHFRPDALVHMAGLVGVEESITDPATNFRLNVHATYLVAEAVRRGGVGRVVFASSSAVYGQAEELPTKESIQAAPLSPYGAAKLASEALLCGYGRAYGFVVRCQRYFNVYGPRQDPRSPYSGVVSVFCDRLRTGRLPVIYGDGLQTRDFISVHDVARANEIAATRPALAAGRTNICTGRAVSLLDLLAELRRNFAAASRVEHAGPRPGDIRCSQGDPSLAAHELGFRAEVGLGEGLAELAGIDRDREAGGPHKAE